MNGRILIVDDDEATAELQRRRLRRADYETVVVTDLKSAREQIDQDDISLIILDYRLEGNRTGLEFYEQLKAAGDAPPAILVTGFSNEAIVVQALRAGIQDFVAKSPDYLDYLPHAVRQVLEKVEAEHRLVESESRKAAMFQSALDGIVTMDASGCIREFNPAAEKIFGHAAGAVLGQKVVDVLVPGASRVEFTGELQRLLETGQSQFIGCRFEVTALHASGSVFPVELSTSVAGAAGDPLIIASVRDMSEQKQAELELRLRHRALEQVSEGILFTDPTQPDNPIIYANKAFERITGYKAEEVIGRNCRILQGERSDPQAVAEMHAAVVERRSCGVELINYRADGKPFWNVASIAPLQDDEGRVTHFVGVLTDVTQRKIQEEQLRQSLKMEAIGRLAGGIAHDFNNLLTIILGNSQFAQSKLPTEDPNLRGLLAEINEAADKAAGLTRQLLAFSRKQLLEPKVIDINGLISRLSGMLKRLIGDNVSLVCHLNPEVSAITADPGQIEQILINLAVNARDAMAEGGKLLIETANDEFDHTYTESHPDVDPGPYVRISVSDTGHGMTADVIEHVFEPFFTTKPLGEGTGLGLATVFGIVKQSGGHIGVYSEPGHGTTFNVYFPRKMEPSVNSSEEASRPGKRGSETILLVEDDRRVRQITSQYLREAGYFVIEASSGSDVQQLAGQYSQPIQLLISDVVMPGLNGRQVADHFLKYHPGARVLFVSGYTNDIIVQRGVLENGMAFLQKPFTQQSLARKVREVLDS